MPTPEEMTEQALQWIAARGFSHLRTMGEIHDALDLDTFPGFDELAREAENDEQVVAMMKLRRHTYGLVEQSLNRDRETARR